MDTVAASLCTVFFLFFITHTTSKTCAPSSCLPTGSPQVRFPFHLFIRQQPNNYQSDFRITSKTCGFPGFNILCDNNNQTILNLPSGEVIVKQISYQEQSIIIDPQFCLPNRINSFSLDGTPYLDVYLHSYTFFNCSSDYVSSRYASLSPVSFDCLSGHNYSVFALPTYYSSQLKMPADCRNISTLKLPLTLMPYQDNGNQKYELQWNMPQCVGCESSGGTCGSSSDYSIICNRGHKSGLQTNTKYGIIFGVALPLICIIVLLYFIKKNVRGSTRHQGIDISSVTINPQPSLQTGIDGPTIESYPKTVVGDNQRRLSNSSDGTCSICLSEYQPKEELRTIPECNHYFHSQCIDAWLRLNATCPLCRNTPESSVVTPCSTTFSSASTSSDATSSA